jgi:hypothetical protein
MRVLRASAKRCAFWARHHGSGGQMRWLMVDGMSWNGSRTVNGEVDVGFQSQGRCFLQNIAWQLHGR